MVADGERIYLGAFWTGLSSVSTGLPVMDIGKEPLTIDLGYPVKPKAAIDPRNDGRIYNALKETGILSPE